MLGLDDTSLRTPVLPSAVLPAAAGGSPGTSFTLAELSRQMGGLPEIGLRIIDAKWDGQILQTC